MIITGAASTLAGLLAAHTHTITTTLGVLDVTTTVVASSDDGVTLAMSWTTQENETRGLVLRLSDADASMCMRNSLFGDSNYIHDLIASHIERAAQAIASDLTTYNPPHVDVDAVLTVIEGMERSDLYQLPNWTQEVREYILAAEDEVEEDLESKIETSEAWSMVDHHAKKIAQALVNAHPGLVNE